MASSDPLDYRFGDVQEVPECRFIRFNKEGMSGSRKYRIKGWRWFENENQENITNIFMQLGVPVLNQPWSASYPYLVVTNLSLQEYGKDYAEITVEYSSEGTYSLDFIRTELSADLTSVNIGPGWVWQSDYAPLEENKSMTIPSGKYTVRCKVGNFNIASVLNTVNKVNSDTWHGFPAGTLLFLGANTSESFSTDGQLSSVESVYSFEYRSLPHNIEYRVPPLFRDEQGRTYNYHSNPKVVDNYNQAITDGDTDTVDDLYYQASFYVISSSHLAYSPVYAGGAFTVGKGYAIAYYPNYAMTSSLGATYDKPIINMTSTDNGVSTTTTQYLHEEVNFTTALGIPDIEYGSSEVTV